MAMVDTPVGGLRVRLSGDVIIETDWARDEDNPVSASPLVSETILGYWENPRVPVPVKLFRRGTAFQFKIWQHLIAIKFGDTPTYKALAARAATAPRAVGGACRDNPFPLLIPCHRVLSTAGWGGYAGQTHGRLVDIKRNLVEFERTYSNGPSPGID